MNIKNFKARSLSYGLALALAAAPAPALAAGHNFGTVYVDELEATFNTYVVEENDNASKISTKVVSYFIKKGEVPEVDRQNFKVNPDSTCRYWPAIANLNLNKYNKFRIHPGDVVKFPETYEELVEQNEIAKTQPWYKEYCSKEHYKTIIYLDKKEAIKRIKAANKALKENPTLSDEYIEAYLKLIGGSDTKYVFKDGAKLFSDEIWRFYDYCPTESEVKEQMDKTKQYNKIR